MAFFLKPENIISKITRLKVRDDDEADGSAPFLLSFFFKIDGESLQLNVKLNLPENPLNINSISNVANFKFIGDPIVRAQGEHNNLPTVPWYWDEQDYSFEDGKGVFESTLMPIPVTIEMDIPVNIEDYIDEIMSFDIGLSDILDLDFGGTCPPNANSSSFEDFLGPFSTQFVTNSIGGFPPFCGYIYQLMEEDATPTQETIITIRTLIEEGLREGLRDILDEVTNDIENAQGILDDAIGALTKKIKKSVAEFSDYTIWDILLGAMPGGILGTIAAGIPGGIVGLIIGAILADADDDLGSTVGIRSYERLNRYIDAYLVYNGGEPLMASKEIQARLNDMGEGDWELFGTFSIGEE